MELTYRQAGDYLLPNIQVPDSPKIGKYGMLRHTFLKNHRKTMLSGIQLTGKLNEHLEDFKSHIEHIDLNGECYGYEKKN